MNGRRPAREGGGAGRTPRRVLALLATLLLVGAAAPALPLAPASAQVVDGRPDVRLLVTELTGVLGPGTVARPDDDVVPPSDPSQGAREPASDDPEEGDAPDDIARDDRSEDEGAPGDDAQEAGAEDDGDAEVPPEGTEEPGVAVPAPSSELDRAEASADELRVRVLVENADTVPVDALRVVVEVHPPVLTRGLLRQALNGQLDTAPLHVHTPDVRDGLPLAPGELAGVEDRFRADEVQWAPSPGGVHPIRIAVVRGTLVLDEVITAAVWLADRPESPLLTSVVWPLDGPPLRGADGVYGEAADRELRVGGRLQVLLEAAAVAGGPGLSLAPAAHLLEDLVDRSDGYVVETREGGGPLERREVGADDGGARVATGVLRRVREVAAELPDPPLGGVYAAADLPALVAGDATTQELAAAAASEGRRRLQLQLGREVDASTLLADAPLDTSSLDLLSGETIVVPYGATTEPALGPDPSIPAPVRPIRAASGRVLTALVTDPYLEEALGATPHPAGGVVDSQRVVAESAMAFLAAPGEADRALVVRPPDGYTPSLPTAIDTLEALRAATWLELVAPSDLADRALRSDQPVELAELGVAEPALVEEIGATTRQLDAVVEAIEPAAGQIGERSTSDLRDDLLRAGSRWFAADPDRATSLVREVQRDIDAAFGNVEVVASGVTLTSDTGQVPITLQRTDGEPLVVVVEVLSQGRLTWPEGRRSEPILLEPGASQTVTFATSSLSTGTFPVTVRVTDPSSSRQLGSASFSVRATAISATALSSTAVVVLVLLLFGTLRRREREPRLAVVDAPGPEARERDGATEVGRPADGVPARRRQPHARR
jgi:hypothetical protein